MALPPGEEDIDYNGFRLEIRRFGSGWRILIYDPESFISFEKNPNSRQYGERNKVIAEAKALVDQRRAKSRVIAESW
jgi:hypothetical protein